MKTIAFFVRHFTERGTEVAIYDYAYYNEEILGNKSIIFCFSLNKMKELNFNTTRSSYSKFKNRFDLIEIDHIYEMQQYIEEYNISIFYTLTHGMFEEKIYEFNNKELWESCKTIKHCVFDTSGRESNYYCIISNYLNVKDKKKYPVLPHIISLPSISDNLRNSLNIPQDAIVFGGYGGPYNFDIKYVHKTIYSIANNFPNIYFLFANFNKFCPDHEKIIHLPTIIDPIEKTKFINTCDAMIWARSGGEIMSIAQGEFSIKNKPIICTKTGDLGHEYILQDKALWYTSSEDLFDIITTFNKEEVSKKDWNAYRDYSPEKVMTIFKNIINTLLDES
jgi:hypothetical protein